MPPADAAPDPLDRPAEALAAELAVWCQEPPRWPGIWFPALPWNQWGFEQRDLARRLAAAAVRAAEAAAAARQREVVLALIRTSRASWDRCPDPDERSAVQAALDVLALAVRSAAGELLGPDAGGGGAGGG